MWCPLTQVLWVSGMSRRQRAVLSLLVPVCAAPDPSCAPAQVCACVYLRQCSLYAGVRRLPTYAALLSSQAQRRTCSISRVLSAACFLWRTLTCSHQIPGLDGTYVVLCTGRAQPAADRCECARADCVPAHIPRELLPRWRHDAAVRRHASCTWKHKFTPYIGRSTARNGKTKAAAGQAKKHKRPAGMQALLPTWVAWSLRSACSAAGLAKGELRLLGRGAA